MVGSTTIEGTSTSDTHSLPRYLYISVPDQINNNAQQTQEFSVLPPSVYGTQAPISAEGAPVREASWLQAPHVMPRPVRRYEGWPITAETADGTRQTILYIASYELVLEQGLRPRVLLWVSHWGSDILTASGVDPIPLVQFYHSDDTACTTVRIRDDLIASADMQPPASLLCRPRHVVTRTWEAGDGFGVTSDDRVHVSLYGFLPDAIARTSSSERSEGGPADARST